VLAQAKAAQVAGLPILRLLAEDEDETIAVEAVELLRRFVDRQSVALCKRLLLSPHAKVRSNAVELLGHIGGRSLLINVRKLTTDPDKTVFEAAKQALKRLEGELERDKSKPWWTESEEISLPSPPGVLPEEMIARLPQPEPEPEPEPAPARLATATPAFDYWVTDWAALPKSLPTEPRALLKLLGMVDRPDRSIVVEALQQAAPNSMGLEVNQGTKSKDWAVARGTAVYVTQAGRADLILVLRPLCSHIEPGVRAAIAETIGAVGKVATIASLLPLIADSNQGVRATAITALANLCLILNRANYGISQLRPLVEDPDNIIREVVELQLKRLAT
jgi:hypothetical protein